MPTAVFSKNQFIALIFNVLIFISTTLPAQMVEPVKWSSKVVPDSDKQHVLLVVNATIDKGWHLYSQFIPDGGPIKTTFTFKPSADYDLVGSVSESKNAVDFYDKNFEMQLKYFSTGAEFTQKIKLKSPAGFRIDGNVEFMVCDDEKCLPPNIAEFSFDVKKP